MFEIDHVAAAVEDADAAVEAFVEATDAEHVMTLDSEEWQYRTAYMLAGEDMFTLISPLSEESFMHDYIESRGPGFHHIGVNVDDLDAAVDAMTALGGEVIMEDDIDGVRREKTLHPRSWFGLQVQLIEWYPEVEDSARAHIEAMRTVKED
ncbi:MAG: VOC family protein [Haloarculaceae archaeon]